MITTVRYARIDRPRNTQRVGGERPEFQRLEEERVRLKAENEYLSSRTCHDELSAAIAFSSARKALQVATQQGP